MPGILTGTIIGMAHALGESGTLAAHRHGRLYRRRSRQLHASGDRAAGSDLPLVGSSGVGFQAKTALAIIVLLMFLFVMNGFAIWLRKKFERRSVSADTEASIDSMVMHPEVLSVTGLPKVVAKDVNVFYGDKHARRTCRSRFPTAA